MEVTAEQEYLMEMFKDELKIDENKINLDKLLELSIEHKIVPWIYRYSEKKNPDIQANSEFSTLNALMKIQTDLMIRELKEIKALTEKENIQILLVKGLALSKVIYNDFTSRSCTDLDIIVSENDMLCADKILLKLGYIRDLGSKEINEKYNMEKNLIYKHSFDYHEHIYKKIVGKFVITVEIKRTTSSIEDRFALDFFQGTNSMNFGNFIIDTLNLDHTFLLLCANTYENIENALFDEKRYYLRDFIDLKYFLIKYQENINWKNILSLANKYLISHKIFYVLSQLCELDDNDVHRKITNYFRPERINYDYGYEHGGIVDWNQSFTSRLFSEPTILKKNFYSLF